MLLNEILNRLTAPENARSNDTGDENHFEYQWTTKSGNKVTLEFIGYKPNAVTIVFDVNYETLETERDIDKEILSSIFFKIGEFIKQYNINELKFEPMDDANDYKEYGPKIKIMKDFIKKHANPAHQKSLISDLTMIISDKTVDDFYLNYVKKISITAFDDEHRTTFLSLLADLENLDHGSISGENRRKRLYLYAIKKYLPDWTVKQHGKYVYAYKEY